MRTTWRGARGLRTVTMGGAVAACLLAAGCSSTGTFGDDVAFGAEYTLAGIGATVSTPLVIVATPYLYVWDVVACLVMRGPSDLFGTAYDMGCAREVWRRLDRQWYDLIEVRRLDISGFRVLTPLQVLLAVALEPIPAFGSHVSWPTG